MSDFGSNIKMLGAYLGMRSSFHDVIASNVANSQTPNYTAKIPTFKAKLDEAVAQSDEMGLVSDAGSELKLETKLIDSNSRPREDGNNVDVSREMSAMVENDMMYMSALKVLNKELAMMRYAITSQG